MPGSVVGKRCKRAAASSVPSAPITWPAVMLRPRPAPAPGRPPLPPPVFHVLRARADEEVHGYSIRQEAARQTSDALQLGPGTLYGCLKRMLAAGLVEESDERPDLELDDERRRYYRMTDLGRSVVRAEARRLAEALTAARARLGLAGGK